MLSGSLAEGVSEVKVALLSEDEVALLSEDDVSLLSEVDVSLLAEDDVSLLAGVIMPIGLVSVVLIAAWEVADAYL